MCPSVQLDAHGTHIEASGEAIEKDYLCPDHVRHVVKDLGRQRFGMGVLVHAVLTRQCLNTLAPMVARPAWLGQHLAGAEMLLFGSIPVSPYDDRSSRVRMVRQD
jgi:hypothetical protein